MADLVYCTRKNKMADILLSIFTPTYNRVKTLQRTYESIKSLNRNFKFQGRDVNFEWIIVDDGSTDKTIEAVKVWGDECDFLISYYWQENQGKHVALNFALSKAQGSFFMTLDSDDCLLPNALEVFLKAWDSINDKGAFCCVSARCIDSNGCIVGKPLPSSPLDVTFTSLRMSLRNNGELLDMYRTEVLRAYPFPQYDERMRFCPEAIVWFEMAKKYKMHILDVPVRIYYYDADTSLIKTHNVSRSVSTYYLWLYMINELSHFVYSNPKEILKAYIGISRDGFSVGYGMSKIMSDVDSIVKKIGVALFMPIGCILSKIEKNG